MVPIQEFAERLSAVSAERFTRENVLAFMRDHRVEVKSLAPYLYFSEEHYTRNLIHRTPMFELIAICWESGQGSAIHNHCDQRCWMAVPYGKVQVLNFQVVRRDASTGFCELRPSTHYFIEPDSPQEVDPEEPVHQVVNAASFGSRAVTLHVYSYPYETCEVYDLKAKKSETVPLVNTTEFGVVKSDMKLEKAAL
jgi:predicted metal-dependent enzyme (double-stranded beta helix superfamily)